MGKKSKYVKGLKKADFKCFSWMENEQQFNEEVKACMDLLNNPPKHVTGSDPHPFSGKAVTVTITKKNHRSYLDLNEQNN